MNLLGKNIPGGKGGYLSLWQQISCILVLLGLTMGSLIVYSSSLYEEKYAQQQLIRQNARVLMFISASSMDAIISEDIPVLETLVSQVMSTDPDIISIRILNETGHVLMEKSIPGASGVEKKIKYHNDITFEEEEFGTIEIYWDMVPFLGQVAEQTKHVIILATVIVVILTMSFYVALKHFFIKPITQINHKLLQLTVYAQNPPLSFGKFTSIEFQNLAESVNSLQQSQLHREQILSDLARARDKAESSNEAKSKFLAVMSHEIRTPINGIMGMAEILKDANLDKDEKRYLKIIEQSAKGLMEIITDILDFSSIEKNKFNLNEVSFSMDHLLNEVKEQLTLDENTKHLTFTIEKLGLPHHKLKGDRSHLKQVLINLLTNAFKFTETGGVTLEVHGSPDRHDRITIFFIVTDTGIGISPADQLKIFDEFKQLNEGYDRRYTGLGLGLALSQRIVRQMGGKISVKSKVQSGSVFSFSLSFKITEVKSILTDQDHTTLQLPETSLPAAPDNHTARQLVLLVEDSLTNQEVVLAMLKGSRYDVQIVTNGKEALEYISHATENNLKAILMDISTPEMDGVTATQHIRNLKGNIAKVPIIALTAHVFQDQQDLFIASGMDDYLAKPVSRKNLLKVLSRWIPQIH